MSNEFPAPIATLTSCNKIPLHFVAINAQDILRVPVVASRPDGQGLTIFTNQCQNVMSVFGTAVLVKLDDQTFSTRYPQTSLKLSAFIGVGTLLGKGSKLLFQEFVISDEIFYF